MKYREDVIQYRDINTLIEDLNASDKGRYLLCDCPSCGRCESFIYKDNPFVIKCNRINNCGYEAKIEYDDEKSINQEGFKQSGPEQKEFNTTQLNQLDWLNRFVSMYQRHYLNPALEDGYRGISAEIIKEYAIDLQHEKMVEWFFKRTNSLFERKENKKQYHEMSFMTSRNLIFPIKDDEGKVNVLAMRSTISENIGKKEIQLYINPSQDARDFIISIPKECSRVVIGEAPLDSLSFKEIDRKTGFIGLTGSQKLSKLSKYLVENQESLKDKYFLLAGDNDKAGQIMNNKLNQILDDLQISHSFFDYPKVIKDPNDFLLNDRIGFEKTYSDLAARDFIVMSGKSKDTFILSESLQKAQKFKKHYQKNQAQLKEASVIALTGKQSVNGLKKYMSENKDLLESKSFFVVSDNRKTQKKLEKLVESCCENPLIVEIHPSLDKKNTRQLRVMER
ncbi:toprim domain-containing protein [Bacillus velezensis]